MADSIYCTALLSSCNKELYPDVEACLECSSVQDGDFIRFIFSSEIYQVINKSEPTDICANPLIIGVDYNLEDISTCPDYLSVVFKRCGSDDEFTDIFLFEEGRLSVGDIVKIQEIEGCFEVTSIFSGGVARQIATIRGKFSSCSECIQKNCVDVINCETNERTIKTILIEEGRYVDPGFVFRIGNECFSIIDFSPCDPESSPESVDEWYGPFACQGCLSERDCFKIESCTSDEVFYVKSPLLHGYDKRILDLTIAIDGVGYVRVCGVVENINCPDDVQYAALFTINDCYFDCDKCPSEDTYEENYIKYKKTNHTPGWETGCVDKGSLERVVSSSSDVAEAKVEHDMYGIKPCCVDISKWKDEHVKLSGLMLDFIKNEDICCVYPCIIACLLPVSFIIDCNRPTCVAVSFARTCFAPDLGDVNIEIVCARALLYNPEIILTCARPLVGHLEIII